MKMTSREPRQCRIKLIRSLFLAGKCVEKGEIVVVEIQLAGWLVEQGSAKRYLWLRVFDRVSMVWRQVLGGRVV